MKKIECKNCQKEVDAKTKIQKYCDECKPLMRAKRKEVRAAKREKVETEVRQSAQQPSESDVQTETQKEEAKG
jgi:uncharacterized membrane-anchored protein